MFHRPSEIDPALTWRAAARRQIVLDTAPTECAVERSYARTDAAKHLQQAALLAARAGRKDVANALLAAWEQMESGT
jgi:hypothetical protein